MTDSAALEPWIRSAAFVAVAATLLLAEALAPQGPRRPLNTRLPNIAIFFGNTLLSRLLGAGSLIAVSVLAAVRGVGLFNMIDLPPWLEGAVALVALDFAMYLQHRLLHIAPPLWRLHAVHHSDTAFDVTTGVRFHPGEMIVSFGLKALAVVVLGAAPWSVLVFETLLSSAALFTHANIALPRGVDRILRSGVVTPDMHRSHHSARPAEHNTNFGFLLSCWDRWLGTYCAAPESPARLRIGLDSFRAAGQQTFTALLMQPVLRR